MLKNLISASQLTDKNLLQKLFEDADKMQSMKKAEYPKPLTNLTLATIFYEPSTRTRLSFETAIQNLGGNLITTENAGEFSSNAKGESLEDTIMAINSYADGIILRHPEKGSAQRAADVSTVPIINAGDGIGDHPTQALLDMYSIYRSKATFDGLKVAMVGDLLYGRTVHALVQLLSNYDVEFYLISPSSLELPKSYLQDLDKKSIKYTVLNKWSDALEKVDVLYMTRVQRERFKTISDYNKVKDDFLLKLPQVKKMKKEAIILHPLPRVNEIDTSIDKDHRAKYFDQVKNGLFARMALLNLIYSIKN